jgi:hypothetical protein
VKLNVCESPVYEEGVIMNTEKHSWRRAHQNRGVRSAVVLGVMTAILVASYYAPSLPTLELMAVTSLSTFAACALGAWWAEAPKPTRGRHRTCGA